MNAGRRRAAANGAVALLAGLSPAAFTAGPATFDSTPDAEMSPDECRHGVDLVFAGNAAAAETLFLSQASTLRTPAP